MDRIREGSVRTEELNQRLSSRNVPSSQLQAQFDIRPVSSKYAKMPIVDRHEDHIEKIQVVPTYDIGMTFNPGSAQGPWSGFATNVNNESRLRNQFFALQKGAGQSTYIPSRESDLYVNRRIPMTAPQQEFYDLFTKPKFDEFNPCPPELGVKFFENCTRQQIKELSQ